MADRSRHARRRFRPWRMRLGSMRLGVAMLLLLPVLLLDSSPAFADYPVYRPSYQGQRTGVSTQAGTECFVADYSWAFPWERLVWIPTPCDFEDQDVKSGKNSAVWNDFTQLTLGRIEVFRSNGVVKSGADTFSDRWGSPWGIGAGGLVNYSQLWVNDGNWRVCDETGFVYSSWWDDLWTPTFDWGSAPCGQGAWYASWSGGYQWTDYGWNSSWAWSGAAYLPCYFCLTADTPTDPPPPPDPPRNLVPKKPPKVKHTTG